MRKLKEKTGIKKKTRIAKINRKRRRECKQRACETVTKYDIFIHSKARKERKKKKKHKPHKTKFPKIYIKRSNHTATREELRRTVTPAHAMLKSTPTTLTPTPIQPRFRCDNTTQRPYFQRYKDNLIIAT